MSKKHRRRGRPLTERTERRYLVLSWIELGHMRFERTSLRSGIVTKALLGDVDYTREYDWLVHSQWVGKWFDAFGNSTLKLTEIGKQALERYAGMNDETSRQEEHVA